MRTVIFLLAGLLVAGAAKAQDQSYADCLVKSSSSWGQPCEKCEIYTGYKRDHSSVYQVNFRNACAEMLEVKVAVEESDGTWRTFPVRALAEGDTLNAFACRGTGKYMYWARKVNDTQIILPSDAQIVSAFPGR